MKRLTENQCAWLHNIWAARPAGLSTANCVRLRGSAKDYSSKYERSLRSAVEAHNTGTALNSPLPSSAKIEEGNFGPLGGRAWRAVIDPLLDAAEKVLAP